jgi:two-component system response regulator HydG
MIEGKILIVDDNEEILVALKMFLGEHFSEVHTREDQDSALAFINQHKIDLCILDMNFSPGSSSGKEGLELMKNIRDIHPNAVVIFITAYGDMDLVIKAIREGATDFIQKPWNDQKLLATVRSAMELSKSRQEVVDLREKQHHLQTSQHKDYQMVWGTSGIMETIMETVDKVAGTDASVIILGENGTGKELMAREIHLRSTRREEVFIKVDLGSLSESLFESELFGHVKGAFTDAHMDKPGRFELASGGTLFLDEIANISTALQTKLLTVIENREVTKLGSNLSKTIDARIISATNMKLDQMVHNGTFREDLLYRLNTITIDIPPLRERMDDLPQLIDFFLGRLGEKYGRETGISRGAIAQLAKHTWPGNIRELKYTLEKAVIMADHAILTERDFLLKSSPVSPEGIRMVNLKQNEREIIKKAIQLNGGNLSQAARHLGISRRTLYNKIRKYEI